MLLRAKNIFVKKKNKIILKNISFNVEKNHICTIVVSNNEERNALLKAFKDGKNLETGKIIFDQENITTQLAKKRPLALVFSQKFLFSVFSVSWKLTNLFLKNDNFYLQANKKYRDAKYVLKDLIDTGLNLSKKEYKDILRELNQSFLQNMQDFEAKRVAKYFELIIDFHKRAIKQILADIHTIDTSILMQRYEIWTLEIEKLLLLNSQLTFLQALWDKFFLLTKMEKSCHCYLEHKNDPKSLFKMKEVTFVANEFLAMLDSEIAEIRKQIRQKEIDVKSYAKNFWKTVTLIENKITNTDFLKFKKNNKFKKWKQMMLEQHNEFYLQQTKIISEILITEIKIVQNYIIETTTTYHQKLLHEINTSDYQEFKTKIAQANKAIVSVRDQAWVEIKEIIDIVGLKALHLNFIWQFTSWERIKIQIIVALIQQKKLIIIDDVLNKTLKQYKTEFNNLVKKLQAKYDLTIIIVTKQAYPLLPISQKLVILQEGDIIQSGAPKFILDNPFNKKVLEVISSPYLNWFSYFNYANSWLEINNVEIIHLGWMYQEHKNLSFSLAIPPEKFVLLKEKDKVKIINKAPVSGWIFSVYKLNQGDWLISVILNDNKIIKAILPSNNEQLLKQELKFNILTGGIYLFDNKTQQLIKRI